MTSTAPEAPRRRGRARRLAALLAVEIVAVVLLLELGLRVAHDHSPTLRRALYMSSLPSRFGEAPSLEKLLGMTVDGFKPRRKHGDFILNSKSLKTKEYTYDKPEGSFRAVILGDSFAFSSGMVPYDALWHVQAQEALAEQLNRSIEFLSLSAQSVGPDFYRCMWELEGSLLDADLVVVAFYVGNDFVGMPKDTHVPEGRWEALSRGCYVVRLVRNSYIKNTGVEPGPRRRKEPAGQEQEVGGIRLPKRMQYDPNRPTVKPKRYMKMNRSGFWIYENRHQNRLAKSFADSRSHLSSLYGQVREQGAEMIVVIIPSELQVYPELRGQLVAETDLEEGSFDMSRPNRLVTEWCVAEGIPYLDLLPAFSERADEEQLYRLRNTHWNVEGNTLAAEELERFLLDRGLVN